MQNRIPVISSDGHPLVPCRPHRARQLVNQGKAIGCWREGIRYLQLTQRTRAESVVPLEYELNIDPGTSASGYAVTHTYPGGHRIVTSLVERHHNCHAISRQMGKRHGKRRNRRGRLRYRKPKGLRQWKPEGWLPPSLRHLLEQHCRMIDALACLYPIRLIRTETGVFDPALMANPDLQGIDYQRGTLFGQHMRAFVFHQDRSRCAYCGKPDGRLEIDHIIPKSQGGPSRPGNLIASCRQCNRRKGNKSLEEFLKDDPERVARILRRADSASYRSATHMNVVMPRILAHATATGIPVEQTDAATTAWNRKRLEVAKTHCHDAALLGNDFNSIGILPEQVAALRNSPKTRKQKANVQGDGTPDGQPYRDYCKESRRQQSKMPTPGHSGKRQRHGPQGIATGDIVVIARAKAEPVKGIAVVMPSSRRIRIRDTKPAVTASISKATLVRRRPAVTCRYQPPSQTKPPTKCGKTSKQVTVAEIQF